ncbi:hypothetical protein [Aminicella lysinilytica]|uniref:Diaminopimelate epimerase n=1 Tax=Aminicella lysinilytica TaxID=433323 RepID=A0A4R6QDW7_9FIRM|nr:hypothetical protein [Aminicella lysinilytica]NLD11439.1 hypothetical protein [Clostridiales bacterium]TDP59629.1 diaminopimelate epimerase [Aminicella lysinilytica]
MRKKINVRIADPAGNITIFVMDPFERKYYQHVATQLLAIEKFHAEQVAFVKSADSMEMCGLEFCGNASRSFALMAAEARDITGKASIVVNVSGSEKPLTVEIDSESNYTKIRMPLPVSAVKAVEWSILPAGGGILVDLGGIMHLVLQGTEATKENFDRIKDVVNGEYDPPAMGVMFYDSAKEYLTPVVYVKDVDTTYFEGSCASGSTAVAIALSSGFADGSHAFRLQQPAGTVTATVDIKDGNLQAVYIEGPVEISDTISVEVEV